MLRTALLLSGGIALLAVALAANMSAGAVAVPFARIPEALWGAEDLDAVIVRSIRLPRAIAGLAVGAGLGVAGAILQQVTRNPLASPGLMGVTAGAAFAVVAALVWLSAAPPLAVLTLCATSGAAAAGLASFVLAGGLHPRGLDPLRLILAGAVVSMFLGAVTGALVLHDPDALRLSQQWLAGSLADRPSGVTASLAPPLVLGALSACLLARPLHLLGLGDISAAALGLPIRRLRLTGLLVATALTALAVALAGPIGFVGLAAPHVARGLLGPRGASLLPASALTGAVLLLAADAAAREIAAPAEVSVGVLTTLLGVPVLVWLLRRRQAA